ncbi:MULTISPECIES: tetratricopeptide repeat protein [unclassified Mesorhizobium]|uniref:tetratricopeptide repeat protein n=1 Tax=unclassified Mesorhizobium TaxID=325217 RepID=UPI0011270BDC|nr:MULTISPECIES: tetratricopeptide repeat protein [unclassified Mesorhizobium]MBZ9985456.1 tetratricopeptide repeat protein [Mesorhizobium sp. BR-1-1-8]TPL32517.1 tetratricopeptide repeat protein [Mesorhizobium sp. B2-4-8]TPL62019.1 tetratricopeptide repeat protein [Mesorhizobium sp. B2-4-1]
MKRSLLSRNALSGRHALFGLLGAIAVLTVLPVATIMPAYAVDDIEGADAPDLTAIKAKIDAKDYSGALAELRDLAQDTQQADVYNLLGFTLRKTGDFKTALTYYTKALELKPDHKAAREYLGELYVETGDMDKAKEQLASLQQLCPAGCDELSDLRQAIDTRVTK